MSTKDDQFLTDAETKALELAAHTKAVEEAAAATEKAEAEAAAHAVAVHDSEVARLEEAELAAAEDEVRKERRRKGFQEWVAKGKPRKKDETLRAEKIQRPTVPDKPDLQVFDAHIAAHAILAAVQGDSYDSFHDNEFQKMPDGSVRCSVKMKEGGHKRFYVHVPDEVTLALHTPAEVKLEEAA